VSAYEARLTQAGKEVAFERDGVRRMGQVVGVSRDGALVVRTSDGDALLYSEQIEVLA
jgi:biotin-(acetyl-CoA carboxylase) ligase